MAIEIEQQFRSKLAELNYPNTDLIEFLCQGTQQNEVTVYGSDRIKKVLVFGENSPEIYQILVQVLIKSYHRSRIIYDLVKQNKTTYADRLLHDAHLKLCSKNDAIDYLICLIEEEAEPTLESIQWWCQTHYLQPGDLSSRNKWHIISDLCETGHTPLLTWLVSYFNITQEDILANDYHGSAISIAFDLSHFNCIFAQSILDLFHLTPEDEADMLDRYTLLDSNKTSPNVLFLLEHGFKAVIPKKR
jgi:hypothetical protein